MKAIELLPEPGIPKHFEFFVPSEINRNLKIYSSDQNITFEKDLFHVTKSAYNKVRGKFMALDDRTRKSVLWIYDNDTNKIV